MLFVCPGDSLEFRMERKSLIRDFVPARPAESGPLKVPKGFKRELSAKSAATDMCQREKRKPNHTAL